jgi:hypothetical protein
MKWWLLILAIVITGCSIMVGSAGATRFSSEFEDMNIVTYSVIVDAKDVVDEYSTASTLTPVLYTELRANLPRLTYFKWIDSYGKDIDADIELYILLGSIEHQGTRIYHYGAVELQVYRTVCLDGKTSKIRGLVYKLPMVVMGGADVDPVQQVNGVIRNLVQRFAADLYEARPDL